MSWLMCALFDGVWHHVKFDSQGGRLLMARCWCLVGRCTQNCVHFFGYNAQIIVFQGYKYIGVTPFWT